MRFSDSCAKCMYDRQLKKTDNADIIFSKDQANYESFACEGHHAFYTFLCKCDLIINRFKVPKLTGMFVEE
jgi:uncharacterized protein with ATP-grasp and redox domains